MQFDEIDGKEVKCVLTDLTLVRASGPKCSSTSNYSVNFTHRFKVDNGAAGNLLPLSIYREIFPNITPTELARSIDHCVQLLAYNKKQIKQLGVCYLHAKAGNGNGHTKLCKFFIVNSRFNPIIGVNCAMRLGLISFNMPIYQDWCDDVSVNSVSNKNSIAASAVKADIPETITKEWIVNHDKYKCLFQGIGHFKCKPVTIEMQHDTTPIRKPPCKVTLALQDKFKAEIKSMVDQGIITGVTQSMEMPEWLNTLVVAKKPNGDLRVCLDPADLNKHIIHPVCNMYTLEDVINKLKDATHFAVFDSTKSFFHIPLDEASKQLTAMLTLIGIYIYNMLAMGLLNATDIF